MASMDNILNLNDDCLLSIFKYLSLPDLCAIKETCVLFDALAEKVFTTFHAKKVQFSLHQNKTKKVGQYTLHETAEIFTTFGHLFRNLSVNAKYYKCAIDHDRYYDGCECIGLCIAYSYFVYAMISEYCGENLKHIQLYDFTFHDLDVINREKRFLKNLETLSLFRCRKISEDVVAGLLKNGKNLRMFALTYRSVIESELSTLDGNFLLQDFPKLEKMRIEGIQLSDAALLNEFFERNPQIKHFSYDGEMQSWAKYVGMHNVGIEEINIKLSDVLNTANEDLATLHQSHTLKRLVIDCTGHQIDEFVIDLAARNSLEGFGMRKVPLNRDLCMAVSKLTNLKTLKLASVKVQYDNHATVLSKSLKNLEELYLDSNTLQNPSDIYAYMEFAVKLKKLFLTYTNDEFILNPVLWKTIFEKRSESANGYPLTIYLRSRKYLKVKKLLGSDVFYNNTIRVAYITGDMYYENLFLRDCMY